LARNAGSAGAWKSTSRSTCNPIHIRRSIRISSKHIIICRILIIIIFFAPLRSPAGRLRHRGGRCLFGCRLRLSPVTGALCDSSRTNSKPQSSVSEFLEGRIFPSVEKFVLRADPPWSAQFKQQGSGGSHPVPHPNPWASEWPATEAHPNQALVTTCLI